MGRRYAPGPVVGTVAQEGAGTHGPTFALPGAWGRMPVPIVTSLAGMDFRTLVSQMPTTVPMVGTLGIQFLELDPQRVVLRLPDHPGYRNHIGGPHAGAMFTVAESASGALVLGNFGHLLDRVTPLAVDATIRYKHLAMGPLYAEALMPVAPQEILAELTAGRRPQWRIEVLLATEDWRVTGEASFLWTLKPTRRRPD